MSNCKSCSKLDHCNKVKEEKKTEEKNEEKSPENEDASEEPSTDIKVRQKWFRILFQMINFRPKPMKKLLKVTIKKKQMKIWKIRFSLLSVLIRRNKNLSQLKKKSSSHYRFTGL